MELEAKMTIKETAGKILLVFYYLQTTDPMKLEEMQMMFQTVVQPKLEAYAELKSLLHNVNSSDIVLYNAIKYLLERGLISKRNQKNVMGGLLIIGPHVTYEGVDIIESVEQGKDKQKIVKSLFNFSFNFSPTMKVDNLIKAEVGNIVGIGGAISGKVGL